MTGKLTESKIAKAKIPAGKRQLILRDGGGLSVRILPGGSKTYWFRYRTAGGRESSVGHMVKIGSAGATPLADARKAARVLAGRVARGGDPAAERQEAKREAERREREAELRAGSTLGALLAED